MFTPRNFLLLFLLFPLASFGQTPVTTSSILSKINAGQAVTLTNAVIDGDLDLTHLANRKPENTRDDDESWTKTYVSVVTAPVSFVNCRFTGKVLAYQSIESGKLLKKINPEVNNTNFNADVTFTGCTFEDDVAFKYSAFKGDVSFSGSRFKSEALFKYAKFSSAPDFSRAVFSDEAIFKYVSFPALSSFSGAIFHGDADFKYAKFKSGANFSNVTFARLANFKYSSFSSPKFKGTVFSGESDFKYASVDGRKATERSVVEATR